MKFILTLVVVLKVANAFFFVEPPMGGRPVMDNQFWKNFENSMKKLEDSFKSASQETSEEEDAAAESSDETEDMRLPQQSFFPFLGPMSTPSRPWWMGKNVCVTKEETDLATGEDANSTSIFGLSSRMETCSGGQGRYTCTTTVREAGRHVRTLVKYECCHGFALKRSKCVQVTLLNITEAAREAAPEFARMMETSGVMEKLEKSQENYTVFVTADQTLDDLRESLDKMNKLELVEPSRRRRSEPQTVVVPGEVNEARAASSEMGPALHTVLLNHVVRGVYPAADFTNNKVVDSLSGHKLRLNVFPGGMSAPVLTVNCKRLVKPDRMTDRGLLHVVDGVLKPVHRSVADIIRDDDRFTIFRSMLEEADLMDRLANDTVTVFAPTDDAFSALPGNFRASHAACSGAIARHHVTAHVLCMSGLVDTWSINTFSGERVRMERTPEGVVVGGNSKISLADAVATNGVVHVVDAVWMPDSARDVKEVFQSRNLTTFQNLLEEAGLSESASDMTWFAPREEAFATPEMQKKLEQLRADPAQLKQILLYHSSQPQIELNTLDNDQDILTRSGELQLHFNMYSEGPGFGIVPPRATVNCARMRITDNKACGANVHEIDRLLIPPTGDMLAAISDRPEFSILNKVIERAAIGDDLRSSGPMTLLAPTDDAFNDLPARILNGLLANETLARQVMEKHILPESVCCHGVSGQSWLWTQQVTATDGSRLQARRDGLGNVHFGRTRVSHCDNVATNGIVHTVTRVLVPREDTHNPLAPFLNANGWRLQGHNNPNVDVMLFGI